MGSDSPLQIHFLGTNGWYDTDTGNTICILIDCPEYAIILDVGNGIYKLDSVTSTDKPFYIFLSHLHIDHICGLHILNKFRFTKELKIFTPAGQEEYLKRFLSPPYTVSYKDLPYSVSIAEYPDKMGLFPFEIQTFPMKHSVPTFGLRFDIQDKVIVYCPDTGYCANVIKAAKDADIFIAECAYLPGESHESWPHLNPETAARIASEARAKKLVLIHFDASRYDSMEVRKRACDVAASIFKNTCCSVDGMVLEIP